MAIRCEFIGGVADGKIVDALVPIGGYTIVAHRDDAHDLNWNSLYKCIQNEKDCGTTLHMILQRYWQSDEDECPGCGESHCSDEDDETESIHGEYITMEDLSDEE